MTPPSPRRSRWVPAPTPFDQRRMRSRRVTRDGVVTLSGEAANRRRRTPHPRSRGNRWRQEREQHHDGQSHCGARGRC
jgi:hypothetical protein